MILAAGFGRRLRPLTDRIPKALVEVGGVTMLERAARRLIDAGVDRLIINVHHHADEIRRFVAEREGFGIEVRISEEPDEPLETGGGLARAAPHFRREAPFFLHNVDIITGIDLRAMSAAHEAEGALATLAVSERETSRLLRFDADGLLGRVDLRSGEVEELRARRGPVRDRAFAGVHVLSPAIFDVLPATGKYSILDPYFRLAAEGRRLLPYEIGDALWLEIGNAERLERARALLRAETEEGGREGG